MSTTVEESSPKTKKLPEPKWRSKFQIFFYAIVSVALVILGAHGLLYIADNKTIMIFGDQDNTTHNLAFAITYTILGFLGCFYTWSDIQQYKIRKAKNLFQKTKD